MLRIVIFGLFFASACSHQQHAVQSPASINLAAIEIPEVYEFRSPQDFEAEQPRAIAGMQWFLSVHPASQAKEWTKTRDFVFDWIEGHPTLKLQIQAKILEPIENDTRFLYTAYMRGAYLIGKALYQLRDTAVQKTTLDEEVAGVVAMIEMYDVFRQADKQAKSRKLERLRSAYQKGKLKAKIAKKLKIGED